MDAAVERYLLLGLRLGRHVDGLVDAYYGPPELAARAEAEGRIEPRRLVADAEALLAELDDGWLADQARGLRTAAGILAGERLAYADEVEACYGVRPRPPDAAAYRAAHARLDRLLPDGDSLRDRYARWQADTAVPPDEVVPLVGEALELLRARADAIVPLPDGEGVDLEVVRDEPWWAFNYYRGGLRSHVVVNVDVQTTTDDVVEIAAHEVYPGHHTERVVKEERLVRALGRLEETILLVPTPQSVVCEGIAETGPTLALDDPTSAALAGVFERRRLTWDPALARGIREARLPLRRMGLDAALLLYEGGASEAEAREYVREHGLLSPEQAAHTVRFVSDATWRSYVVCYSAGRELCEAWVGGDPARFRTLLSEHVRVRDLLPSVSSAP
jgi:hypothetical protein